LSGGHNNIIENPDFELKHHKFRISRGIDGGNQIVPMATNWPWDTSTQGLMDAMYFGL